MTFCNFVAGAIQLLVGSICDLDNYYRQITCTYGLGGGGELNWVFVDLIRFFFFVMLTLMQKNQC